APAALGHAVDAGAQGIGLAIGAALDGFSHHEGAAAIVRAFARLHFIIVARSARLAGLAVAALLAVPGAVGRRPRAAGLCRRALGLRAATTATAVAAAIAAVAAGRLAFGCALAAAVAPAAAAAV